MKYFLNWCLKGKVVFSLLNRNKYTRFALKIFNVANSFSFVWWIDLNSRILLLFVFEDCCGYSGCLNIDNFNFLYLSWESFFAGNTLPAGRRVQLSRARVNVTSPGNKLILYLHPSPSAALLISPLPPSSAREEPKPSRLDSDWLRLLWRSHLKNELDFIPIK